MEIKPKETLRDLFTTALCLDISIAERRYTHRTRVAPARLIDDISTPPSKRVAISTPSHSSLFSPDSRNLLELFSPETQRYLTEDFLKDDIEIKRITDNSEIDDPNYVHFNTNPKIGTDLEFWVCINIKCPGCGEKLYKYSSPSMPAIDVRCNNSHHNLEHGPKYYQIKATEVGTTYRGLEYFSLKDKYICVGSYRFGYNCHVITADSKDKDILIGYICLAYTKSGENIRLDTNNSFILKPNLLFKPKFEQKEWTYYSYLDTSNPRITFHLEMFNVIKINETKPISTNIIYDATIVRTDAPPPPAFMKYLIMKMKYLNLKKKLLLN